MQEQIYKVNYQPEGASVCRQEFGAADRRGCLTGSQRRRQHLLLMLTELMLTELMLTELMLTELMLTVRINCLLVH